MINWNYIISGISVLLLVYLLRQEIKRSNKSRLAWRLLAVTVAVSSLACIYLPVKYSGAVARNQEPVIILLTEGFSGDSVNNLVKMHAGNARVFTLDNGLTSARQQNAVLISNINAIPGAGNLAPVHVFGFGLETDELQQLGKRAMIFHPAPVPAGPIAVHWNSNLVSGEKLYVQGTYNNTKSKPLQLLLTAFNTTLDSAIVPAGKKLPFELTTIPRHTGRAVYSFVVLDGKDTLDLQPVPVQVKASEPLRVLFLASSPDFENKFLTDWLAQKGFEVSTRTLISKNRINAGFINTGAGQVTRITTQLLSNVSIVITDATELASLSPPERSAIQSFVAERSGGLVIRADSTASNAFYTARFPLARIANDEHEILLRLYDTATALIPLVPGNPVFIRNQNRTQPLVTDKQNRIFVNSALYGKGKIILTTVTNTYSWALAGHKEAYHHFWSELLKKSAGKRSADESWRISPAFPKVNGEVTIHVESGKAIVPTANVSGTSVYLENDAKIPSRWNGVYWPTKPGWQASIQANGNTFWWYVFRKHEWKTVDAFNTMQMTKQQAGIHSINEEVNHAPETNHEERDVPKILFFFLFITSCGFLWLENKIQQL